MQSVTSGRSCASATSSGCHRRGEGEGTAFGGLVTAGHRGSPHTCGNHCEAAPNSSRVFACYPRVQLDPVAQLNDAIA
jgi:hypothetical protein